MFLLNIHIACLLYDFMITSHLKKIDNSMFPHRVELQRSETVAAQRSADLGFKFSLREQAVNGVENHNHPC